MTICNRSLTIPTAKAALKFFDAPGNTFYFGSLHKTLPNILNDGKRAPRARQKRKTLVPRLRLSTPKLQRERNCLSSTKSYNAKFFLTERLHCGRFE